MRLAAFALLATAACSSKPSLDKVRFIFDVDVKLAGDLEISIGGKPVTLDPVKPNISTTSGYLDFTAAELSVDAKPTIKLRTPCSDGALAETDYERRPPNEQNVVVFRITARQTPKPSFVVTIDPKARSIQLGSYVVPSSHADVMPFWGTCSFEARVDGETAAVPAPSGEERTLLVASKASECLTEGMVVYAAPGATCNQEWSQRRTGQLAYWSKVYPNLLFKTAMAAEISAHRDARCVERGFFGRC